MTVKYFKVKKRATFYPAREWRNAANASGNSAVALFSGRSLRACSREAVSFSASSLASLERLSDG